MNTYPDLCQVYMFLLSIIEIILFQVTKSDPTARNTLRDLICDDGILNKFDDLGFHRIFPHLATLRVTLSQTLTRVTLQKYRCPTLREIHLQNYDNPTTLPTIIPIMVDPEFLGRSLVDFFPKLEKLTCSGLMIGNVRVQSIVRSLSTLRHIKSMRYVIQIFFSSLDIAIRDGKIQKKTPENPNWILMDYVCLFVIVIFFFFWGGGGIPFTITMFTDKAQFNSIQFISFFNII